MRKSTTTPKVLHPKAGDSQDYWKGDGIEIWAPFDHNECKNPDADPNALSYVLYIKCGNCNIVFGGDATEATWKEIYKRRMGLFPKVHLLKASHHGRKTGYHYESVKAMNPEATVLSVGELKKKDDAQASYERYNRGCYSTLYHGNIVATRCENGTVVLYDENYRLIP
jgi:competence protein ComEC